MERLSSCSGEEEEKEEREVGEGTEENGVQRSSGPQQPAKGPLALMRRQIAK